jgi:hypothetical protein
MAILGGSPLGLIGVKSTPVQSTGMSTFNGGSSRNINVNKYNTGINPNAKKKGTESLLSGKTTLSPYGNIGSIGTENGGGSRMDKSTYGGVNKNSLHNNAVYDTSLLNIIERLSSTVAAVRPSDFAYLKDVGVYPNNRLMIARRFLSPHNDNIYGKAKGVSSIPMAIMISWKNTEEDFVEISFGEEWVPANADFTNVMNSLGEDFGMSGKLSLGNAANAAFNIVSLPGFTEVLQRKVLVGMGILDSEGDEKPLPTGNPNLIKEAKRRKNIPYTDAGSGLKCTVNIKMTVEWEQKFISGIDPTIVFQDIIATTLRFGTSKSDFYGLTKEFEQKVEKWVNNPQTLAEDFTKYITDALSGLATEVKAAITTLFDGDKDKTKYEGGKAVEPNAEQVSKDKNSASDTAKATALKAYDDLLKNAGTAIKKTIQKYRLEIEGIARALSGMPSTPWHITIGNPLRPVFCAGDMYMAENMTLKLGPNLAFNDLPSSITADFTLTNARPWGLQEILAKFNAGSLRVSNGLKDANSLKLGETLQNGKTEDGEPINDSAPSPTASTATASTANAATGGGASKVPNSAEQKASIPTVDVPKTGPLSAEETKAAALKKDVPVVPGTNAYGFPTTGGLPVNPTTTMASGATVTVPSTTTVTTVATGTVASVSNVVPSAVSTTKEGNAGEQINSNANSTIPVSVQNMDFSGIRI